MCLIYTVQLNLRAGCITVLGKIKLFSVNRPFNTHSCMHCNIFHAEVNGHFSEKQMLMKIYAQT